MGIFTTKEKKVYTPLDTKKIFKESISESIKERKELSLDSYLSQFDLVEKRERKKQAPRPLDQRLKFRLGNNGRFTISPAAFALLPEDTTHISFHMSKKGEKKRLSIFTGGTIKIWKLKNNRAFVFFLETISLKALEFFGGWRGYKRNWEGKEYKVKEQRFPDGVTGLEIELHKKPIKNIRYTSKRTEQRKRDVITT